MSRGTRCLTALLLLVNGNVESFTPLGSTLLSPQSQNVRLQSSRLYNVEKAQAEAAQLLQRAKELRDSIPQSPTMVAIEKQGSSEQELQEKNGASSNKGVGYRLYVDIGREEGTWMEPKWGASGSRIEFTLDVAFDNSGTPCPTEVAEKMVKDNFGGKSTVIQVLDSSKKARLRGGFDSMQSAGGAYRLDTNKKDATVRFFADVAGSSSSYGDINIPKGCLYFSLPCFGGSIRHLSRKEGPVTVRQTGWHTGWRRAESRIVGTFRAVPLDEARVRDKF
jgi:hypothetical protein